MSRNGSVTERSRHSKSIRKQHGHRVRARVRDTAAGFSRIRWKTLADLFDRQSVTHGIDKAGEGLIGMFEGKNFGKAVLEVASL